MVDQKPPPKYIKINGITKLNPEYTKWQRGTSQQVPTTLHQPDIALPVVSNMDDYQYYNNAQVQGGFQERPLAQSVDQAFATMQTPEYAQNVGLREDQVVDSLLAILAQYEVPLGLINKILDLKDYDILEFMIDDSGSMNAGTDSWDQQGRQLTRWQEAIERLKSMIAIIAYVPTGTIRIKFLNRPDVLEGNHEGQNPDTFIATVCGQLDEISSQKPYGRTPALKCFQESFAHGRGKKVSRYFFGDGVPNEGEIPRLRELIQNRPNPKDNPITLLSCTNEDDQVEWMKELEEVAPYCAEYDDFNDEFNEIQRDQGSALPFTKGFHLVGQLVAAMNPYDLDAMDESVPFTKKMIDNLLGVDHDAQEYRHYFNHFCEAQRNRKVETKMDSTKKKWDWSSHYNEFLNSPRNSDLLIVREFKDKLESKKNKKGFFEKLLG